MKKATTAMLALLAIVGASANTTVKKPMPKLADEDKLITLQNRFYYFDGDELHCYNTKTGEDTNIEDYFIPSYRTAAKWYDSASDCVFITAHEGGTIGDVQTVYRLSKDNTLKSVISLSEGEFDMNVEPDGDSVHIYGYVDSNEGIPGIKEGEYMNQHFSLGLKPWKFSKQSLDAIKKPDLKFYAITAPGVNIRSYGDPKAPKLGHFYALGEDTCYEVPLMPEDSKEGYGKFTPWHPEAGDIFASQNDSYTPEGWTCICLDGYFGLNGEAYVSSKFVSETQPESISTMGQIKNEFLRGYVHQVTSEKYPGMWLLGEEDGMDPGCIRIGKEIGGMIVFPYQASWPSCYDPQPGKRIYIDEFGNLQAGSAVVKTMYITEGGQTYENGKILDLSKLNDADLDIILSTASPLSYIYPALVKFQNGENLYWIPK